MADHAAVSTQERYPWKAVARTVLQLIVGLAVSAPLIVAAITGESAEVAGGALAVFLTVSAAITRLMAVPLVNGWLTAVGLGTEPKPMTPPVDPNLTPDYRDATLRTHSPIYSDDDSDAEPPATSS